MPREGQVIAGSLLAAAGLGGLAYVGFRLFEQGKAAQEVGNATVSLTPEPLSATAAQQTLTLTLRWSNPSHAAVQYAAQAAILAGNGQVAGHFFSTLANAQTAEQAFSSSPAQARADAADPSMRLASMTVQPGQEGTAVLYALVTPSEVQQPMEVVVWLQPGANGQALLAHDPSGAAPGAASSAVSATEPLSVQ